MLTPFLSHSADMEYTSCLESLPSPGPWTHLKGTSQQACKTTSHLWERVTLSYPAWLCMIKNAFQHRSSLRCTLHSGVPTHLFKILSVNLGRKLHGLSHRGGWTPWKYCLQQPCHFPASAATPRAALPASRAPGSAPHIPPALQPFWARRLAQEMSYSSEIDAPEPGNQ